jgi:hypothetical protein
MFYHSNTDAPQYVQDDVSSGYFFGGMFYCTHRSNMDARQYVEVDVPPEFPVP